MVEFRLYHPKTYQLVSDLSSDVVDFQYTVGVNGDAGGTALVEITVENKAIIQALRENSHFISFGLNQRFGAVVDKVALRDGIAKVTFIGFMGYMDKQNAEPAHKSGQSTFSTKVGEKDKSWAKTFYADNAAGLVYALLHNHIQVIRSYGYTEPFTISRLAPAIELAGVQDWQRTYRVNGLDLTTMRAAIDSAMNDGSLMLDINVNTSSGFKWDIGYQSAHRSIAIDQNMLKNVTVNEGESINRSAAWAVGSDVDGLDTIARLAADPNVAFSTYNAEGKAEGHKNIARYNAESAKAMQNSNLQVNFDYHTDLLQVGDKTSVDLGVLGSYTIVITEMSIAGVEVSYVGQVVEVDSPTVIAGLRKATSRRSEIVKPLASAYRLSQNAMRKVSRPTGRRS